MNITEVCCMQIVKTGLSGVLLRVFDRWDRYEGRMRLKICAHILQTLQHLCNISKTKVFWFILQYLSSILFHDLFFFLFLISLFYLLTVVYQQKPVVERYARRSTFKFCTGSARSVPMSQSSMDCWLASVPSLRCVSNIKPYQCLQQALPLLI